MRYIVLFITLLFADFSLAQSPELPSPIDKAAEFKKLLINKNYKDLSFYLDDYLGARTIDKDGRHYLTTVLENLFSKKASDRELTAVTSWVEADDTAAWARILRSFFYLNQLSRFPAISFDKKDKFIQRLIEQAAEDSEMGVRLARDNVCARYTHFKIARYQNFKNDYQKRFDVLTKLYPQYFQVYYERLIQLSPKWGGSPRDLINFAKQTAALYDDKSVLKSLPLYAHKLMAESSKDPKKYLSKTNVINEIQDSERLVSQAFPKSSRYLKVFSELAKKGGFEDLAQRALRQAEDRDQKVNYYPE